MSGQYSPSGMELPDETRLPRHSSLLLKPPATTRQDATRCYFTHMSHYIIIILTGGRAFEFQAVYFVTGFILWEASGEVPPHMYEIFFIKKDCKNLWTWAPPSFSYFPKIQRVKEAKNVFFLPKIKTLWIKKDFGNANTILALF